MDGHGSRRRVSGALQGLGLLAHGGLVVLTLRIGQRHRVINMLDAADLD